MTPGSLYVNLTMEPEMIKHLWYVMDPDDGLTAYDTPDAAEAACQNAMKSFTDNAGDDGWPEDIGTLEWGKLDPSAVATRTSCEPAPDGSDFDTLETWELVVVQKPDSIARALAHLTGVLDSESPMSLHARITAARAELILHHPPEDDDRSAVTFWLPRSAARREEMARAFEDIARIFRDAPPASGLD